MLWSETRALARVLLPAAALLAAGCGSGGSDDPSEPPQASPPPLNATLSIGDAAIDEGDNGTVDLVFAVELSEALSTDVTADYMTSDGTATAGDDYIAASGTLSIAAASTTGEILVLIEGDTEIEDDETFTLTLSNPSANVTLAAANATGSIRNDDTAGTPPGAGAELNDTGVTSCANALDTGLDCDSAAAGTDDYPGQDAEYGRDVSANGDGDGRAGFSLTKLDADGNPLADQSADYGMAPWDCVRDEVTGLVWEIKTDDGGLRDHGWSYTWYRSNGVEDRGVPGLPNAGACVDENGCDTEKYVAAVNAVGLCGHTDWRLPTRTELLSLVDFGTAAAPFIDTTRFPRAANAAYWSAESDPPNAWAVDLRDGLLRASSHLDALAVRLVHGDDQ